MVEAVGTGIEFIPNVTASVGWDAEAVPNLTEDFGM